MNIATAIEQYKKEANFFAPEYDQENQTLNSFRTEHPQLSSDDITTLQNILLHAGSEDKFFVADLLYLYSAFDIELLDPLIENSISLKDPSLNRIFLKPCIQAFGVSEVSEILAEKFSSSNPPRKASIASLVYWLVQGNNSGITSLEQAIVNRSKQTDNIIELYYYNQYFPGKILIDQKIPHSAEELERLIEGDLELENLLYNELGWQKKNGS